MVKKSKTVSEDETLIEKVARLELENAKYKIKEDHLDDSEVRLDSYVDVMSLYNGKLTLSTQPLGKGTRFTFNKFGETKRILYNELASVIENYRRFLEEGIFYIISDKIVRRHGLIDIYEKILDKEKIEKILQCDPKVAVKFYEQATESQRETINGFLIKDLKDGTPDLNVVNKISAIAGRDLVKIAREAKELEELPVS